MNPRPALVAIVAMAFALSASAQMCPTSAPPQAGIVFGSACATAFVCPPASPLMMMWGGPLEACDTVTWNFGDGSPAVISSGSATHTYNSVGQFTIHATASNSLGSASAGSVILVGYGKVAVSAPRYAYPSAGYATVVLTRTSSAGTAQVTYATQDLTAHAGTDYVATSGTATFNNGQLSTTFQVPLVNKPVNDPQLYFAVQVTAQTPGWFLLSDNGPFVLSQDVQIVDSYPPTFALAAHTFFAHENDGTATLQVVRSGDTTQSNSVNFAVFDSNQTVRASGTLNFTPGEFVKPFSVAIPNDNVYNGGSVWGATITAVGNTRIADSYSTADLRIFDDDPPPALVVDDVRVVEGDHGSTTVSFPVHLTAPMTSTVQFSASDGGGSAVAGMDYTLSPTTVTFAPGQTLQQVVATVQGNTVVEPDKTFSLRITSSGGPFVNIVKPVGVCTIVNDDHAFNPSSLRITNGQTGHLTLLLGQGPATADTMTVASSAPGVASVPASVTIPANARSVDVPVTAHGAGSATITASLPASLGSDNVRGSVIVTESLSITGVTPDSGSTAGGTLIRISDTVFSANCWPFFGGIAAHNAIVTNANEIVAATPSHAAGPVDVSVRCSSDLADSMSLAFAFAAGDDPAPSIQSINPSAGAAGQMVTINGSRFRRDDHVAFGNAAATIVSAAPDALVVTLPDLPPGIVNVTLNDSAGRSITGPNFTLLDAAAPQIATATPQRIAPGGELLVIGSAFRPSYRFALGDTQLVTNALTDSRGVLRLPSVVPGSYDLTAVDASGHIVARGPSVTVATDAPAIFGVTPPCASSDGGGSIWINGSGFTDGATVTIGGATASVTLRSPGILAVTLPAGTPGMAAITVTNPDGSTATFSNGFRFVSPYDPDRCAPRRHAAAH